MNYQFSRTREASLIVCQVMVRCVRLNTYLCPSCTFRLFLCFSCHATSIGLCIDLCPPFTERGLLLTPERSLISIGPYTSVFVGVGLQLASPLTSRPLDLPLNEAKDG